METIISKIKLRRGTEEGRKQTVFDEGEPAFAIDTGRLTIGNGVLSGGIPVMKSFYSNTASLDDISLSAVSGDIAYVNNRLYYYGDTWLDASAKISNNSGLAYDDNNILYVNNNAPIIIDNNAVTLNYNTNTFYVNNNGGLDINVNSPLSADNGISLLYDNTLNINENGELGVSIVDPMYAINTPTPSALSTVINNTTYYSNETINSGFGLLVNDPIYLSDVVNTIVSVDLTSLSSDVISTLSSQGLINDDSETVYTLSTLSSVVADDGRIMKSLSLKIDNDTIKVDPQKGLYADVQGGGIDTRTLSSENGSSLAWCRIYSDGWCEQWGRMRLPVTGGGTVTVELLQPYNSIFRCVYSDFVNFENGMPPELSGIKAPGTSVISKTSNSLVVYIAETDVSGSSDILAYLNWHIAGMIS